MVDENVTFRLKRGAVAWREVDGEAVVLDLQASVYLGVNPSGTLLWKALEAGATKSELQGKLIDTFSIDSSRAEADVAAFIEKCRQRDLLERS